MTDFQNWWDGYFHEINGQKETAQAAWQARGELDAVRIKELEGAVKLIYSRFSDAVAEIAELAAELDKAREGLGEAKTQVIDLCNSFNVPLPEASIDRYNKLLRS